MLLDGGHVAGPHLQLELLELPGRPGVEVVPPDQLEVQPFHDAPQDDVEELHVVVVGGQHLLHQPHGDRHRAIPQGRQQDEGVLGQLGVGEVERAVEHAGGQHRLVLVHRSLPRPDDVDLRRHVHPVLVQPEVRLRHHIEEVAGDVDGLAGLALLAVDVLPRPAEAAQFPFPLSFPGQQGDKYLLIGQIQAPTSTAVAGLEA